MKAERSTRLLLVEDDDDDFILAKDYLDEIPFLNIEITRATNADDALESIKSNNYDLCLVDYRLGATNGIDLLKSAKKMGFTSPIIMLTGQADDDIDRIALGAGAADYLVKGELTSARFARSIRYALARQDVETERMERVKISQEIKAKDRFLAHLSHELRTPLTAILGYTELLLNSDCSHQTELEVIHRNGKHLLNLLNDVLDLSKIAANKLELAKQDVALNALLADIYTLMRMPALDKGLQLSILAPSGIPKIIQADPTRLRQVLINLISNAIKFSDDGEIVITLECSIEAAGGLKISIRDSGIGISEEQIKQIFKPFVQLEDVVTRSIGGSGLGLAISNELVRRMEGAIEVKSELGIGSCFTVILPLDIEPLELEPLDMLLQNKSVQPLTQKFALQGRVLVVDDLRDIRTLIGHMINRLGPNVIFARDGKDAVHQIISPANSQNPDNDFDLVIMDIHMPVMDGVSAVKKLRAMNIRTPVVALTAANMKGSREHFLEQGFSDVLSKPVDAELLEKALAKYLNPHSAAISISPLPECTTSVNALIVEDDKDAAEAIAALLNAIDVQVTIADNAQLAIDKIKQSPEITHVFLDLHLGESNGLEVAHYIHQNQQSIKSIIMTGAEVSAELIDRHGLFAVLQKPISLSQLENICKNK